MKKLLLTLIFLTSITMLSQNVSVDKLMSLNGSADIFEKLITTSVQSIPADKQADFKSKAGNLSTSKFAEAQKYFQKKYSPKDIEDIYNELSQSDRLSYSEKTNAFIKEWRSFKAEYQTAVKELCNSYQ